MYGNTAVIEALCRVIEQCVALIEDEQKAKEMLAAMREAIGEKTAEAE